MSMAASSQRHQAGGRLRRRYHRTGGPAVAAEGDVPPCVDRGAQQATQAATICESSGKPVTPIVSDKFSIQNEETQS